jgi:O-antigen/teichoic acid export membrane protein
MDIYRKFTKDVGLVAVTEIITKLKPLIFLPIITKALGTSDYGVYTTLFTTILFLMPISSLGLNFSVVRLLASEKDKKKIKEVMSSVLFVSLAVSGLVSLLLFFSSDVLANSVFGEPGSAGIIQAGAILVLLQTVFTNANSYFRMRQRMLAFSTFKLLEVFAPVLLAIVFLLQGHGLLHVVYSFVAVDLAISAILVFIILKDVGFSLPKLGNLKPYISFGTPMVLSSISSHILHLGDRYIIALFMGAAAVGVYAVSYTVGDLVLMLLAPITLSLLAPLSKAHDSGMPQQVSTYLGYSVRYFLMIAIPAAVGISLLSVSVVRSLATPDFIENTLLITSLIAFANIAFGLYNIISKKLMLVKKTRTIAALLISTAGANIALNLLMVPVMGTAGAALSTLACFIALLLMTSLASKSSGIRIPVDYVFIAKCILSAALMGLIISYIDPHGWLMIAVVSLIGAGIYFGLLILLKAFRKNEMRFFKSFVTKAEVVD